MSMEASVSFLEKLVVGVLGSSVPEDFPKPGNATYWKHAKQS
jgi:hypothetical protein